MIPGCFGFALFLSVIGPENSRHFLNQSDAKLKQSRLGYLRFPALWSPAFSRALVSLPVSS